MICPNCGANNNASRTVCRECGFDFIRDRTPKQNLKAFFSLLRGLVIGLCVAYVLFQALYKAYYWVADWRMQRYYERRGAVAPTIETFTMDDDRLAHAITFFGDDGDTIYIPELDCAYRVTGSIARVEIADSHWFDANPEDAEGAIVTLSPICISASGAWQELPKIELNIDTPVSPLQLVTPEGEYETVYTSVYNLALKVVPDSTIYVNGENVTDEADFQGKLKLPINVYAQGENNISILVDTKNHKQTRKDIVLYRAPQSIRLEPSLNLGTKASGSTFTVTGIIDPTATLSVDTKYVENSIEVEEDGNFSFDAKMTEIGDNTVTFRASKEGLTDTVMSVKVYYVPTLKEYSDKAWAMDYDQLKVMTDVWNGAIFLCKGEIKDIVIEGDKKVLIMDVGKDGTEQLVALENKSSREEIEVGSVYRAYADVDSLYFYVDKNLPYLISRYILLPN